VGDRRDSLGGEVGAGNAVWSPYVRPCPITCAFVLASIWKGRVQGGWLMRKSGIVCSDVQTR
jgi:hypothetical protein